VPATTITRDNGELTLTRLHRKLPFWHRIEIMQSPNLQSWTPVTPSSTTYQTLETGLFLRTDHLSVDAKTDAAFFRHELVPE
jgi:hypothetical protein